MKNGTWSVGGETPSLNVSKSGPDDDEIYADEVITYHLSVNGSNVTGTVYITDTFQPDPTCTTFTPLTTAGGTVISDASGNVTITWSVPITASGEVDWAADISFEPDATSCPTMCNCCGLYASNHLAASARGCQDCTATGNASTNTAIQCEDILESQAKEVWYPEGRESCTTRAYTSTYVFGDFTNTPTWQGMVFTDELPYQSYITDSVWISITDGTQACTATFSISSTDPTDPLVIGNISPTYPITVPGATLRILFQATVTGAGSPCADESFYDWSYFNIGVTGNSSVCPGNSECDDGVFEEGAGVEVEEPSVSVDVTNVPPIVSDCGVYTPLITLRRESDVPAYDVRLRFPITDYAIIEVLGFGGATPTFTTTDPITATGSPSYTWHYAADAFTTAITSTVRLRVRRHCDAGGPVQATVTYANRCGGLCSNSDSESPHVLDCAPIIYKFPEVIYASGDVVTWTLTAINAGAGTAHGVTLTDTLASDLAYVRSSITSTKGSVAGVTPLTSTHLVTWADLTILPAEEVTIKYVAEIIGCDELTNTLYGKQGCLGETCKSCEPKQSHVELPDTVLINTNQFLSPMTTCYTRTITATVRNAGLLSVYTTTVTETLPASMDYISGSTEYAIGTGETPPTGWTDGAEPITATTAEGETRMVWSIDQITELAQLNPKQTVWIRFDAYVDCNFREGILTVRAGYLDACREPRSTATSSHLARAEPPNVTLQKVGRNVTDSSWEETVYGEPTETVVWAITLTNASETPAYMATVTDVLPTNTTFSSATPAPTDQSGQEVAWRVGTLTNTTWSARITATVDTNGCRESDTTNAVTATWGCPETSCREQATDDALLRTRPLFPSVLVAAPDTLHQCGGPFTITLENQGPPAYTVTLTNTLPSGYYYADDLSASTPVSGEQDLGQTAVFTWAELPTGPTTLTFQVRNATGGGCEVPTGPNTVTLKYDDHNTCLTGPYMTSTVTPMTILTPNLTASKTPVNQIADDGETVTWTVAVTNTGTGYAPNVVVTDAVGTGFSDGGAKNGSYPGGSSAPVVAGRMITWTPPFTLEVGETWTADVTATVGATGLHRNVVTATGTCGVGCTYAAPDDTTYVTLKRDFGKGPEIQTGTIGSLTVFTLTASLPDETGLYENLTLTDTLPPGLGYVTSTLVYTPDADNSNTGIVSHTPTITPGGTYTSGNVVWELGDLSGTVQMDGVITAVIQDVGTNYEGVRLTNALTMTYTDDEQPYVYTDTADVDVLEPNVALSKAVSSSSGSLNDLDGTALLTYTLRLTNTGSSPAYDVVITDALPSGISVTALHGGDARSGPVQGPGTLTWTVAVMSETLPGIHNPLVLSYTARLSGAIASGNEDTEIITLTNLVSATYSSLPGEPFPGEERDYGPITDTAAISTTEADVDKSVIPESSSSDNLRLGDVVTYTIMDEVPPGLIIPPPYQYDYLPDGFRYVTGTFAVTTNLPFAGSSLTDTLTPPFVSRSGADAGDRGVDGDNATDNPNVGPRYDEASQQAIEWWFQTLDNAGRDITGLVTITFQAQVVGIDLQGGSVWPNQLASEGERNYTYLLWNTEDVDAYTSTVPVNDDSAWVPNDVGQPHLEIEKSSIPPSGAYGGASEHITYTLTLTNDGHTPAYDIVISDTLPAGLTYVTSTISSTAPPTIAFAYEPSVSATEVITWRVNELWGTDTDEITKTASITVVAQVTDTIGANLVLTNRAAIPYYDSQPGDGPGPHDPDEHVYTDGVDTAWHRTVDGGIAKTTQFSPPPTATLGSLVTYTLIAPAQPISATLYDVMVTDTIDSRLYIEHVTTEGGTSADSDWDGQTVTATFASVPHSTQAFITVTARISDGLGADAGETITNSAVMTHTTADEITRTNTVSTEVGEPDVTVVKSVASSAVTTDLDGTALLTYTLRLTNSGNSPAYSLHITDAVPSGISVTAQYGGDANGGPVVGPGTLTWTIDELSNEAPDNTALLTYTARITQALSDAALENVVDLLYHSLTETIPGVRPYTDTDQADVETAPPSLAKSTDPITLKVGDIVTYHLVFTVPAGTVGMGGDSYLEDTLPPGVWAISGTEALTWTPAAVEPITFTDRATGTTSIDHAEVVTWTFGEPITSLQDAPTVITLTFQAQATGVDADGDRTWWPDHAITHTITNTVELTQRGDFIDEDDTTNEVIQPDLSIDKDSIPPSDSLVARGEAITYTLSITNAGHGPAYDIVVTDTLPVGIDYVRTISAPTPSTAITPDVDGQAITYTVSELAAGPGATMVISVVARVTDTIGANLLLTNTAAITYYDSQPGDGPQTGLTPTQRVYTDGVDSVVHRTIDAAISKAVTPTYATLGDWITYTIRVPEPPITATLYNVTVTDELSDALQLHDVITDGVAGDVSAAGNAFTVTYASILSLTQRTITVTAVLSHPLGAEAGDVITNVAMLTHRDGGPIPSNEPPFTVTEPSLDIDKASNPQEGSAVEAGDAVTYTVRLTNATGVTVSGAYDLVITDTLPEGLDDATPSVTGLTIDGTSVTGYTDTYSASTFTVTLPTTEDIPPGGALLLTYTTRVDSDVQAGIDLTNRAGATWSSLPGDVPGDRDYGPITDTTTLTTPQATGLTKQLCLETDARFKPGCS